MSDERRQSNHIGIPRCATHDKGMALLTDISTAGEPASAFSMKKRTESSRTAKTYDIAVNAKRPELESPFTVWSNDRLAPVTTPY